MSACPRCGHGPARHDCAEVFLSGPGSMLAQDDAFAFVLKRYRELKKLAFEAEKRAEGLAFAIETYRQEAKARAELVATYLRTAIGKELDEAEKRRGAQ